MDKERVTSLLLLAEQAEGKSKGADEAAWFDRLEAEHERLLAALSWFLERGDLEKALRLGAALYSFWHTRGYLQEGREWLQKLLAAPGGSASIRAKVLHRAGMLAFRTGDQVTARALFEEGLKMAREIGDKRQIAATLLGLGRLVALRQGDYQAGHRLFDEGLTIARELGDRPSEGAAIHCLAALARLEGDQPRAVALYGESLTLRRELGDNQGVAIEQLNLGFMAFHQGDTHSAARMFADSLRSSYERADKYVMPPNLVGLAGVSMKSGDPARAARLLGAAGALLKSAGLEFDPDDQAEHDRIADAVRAKLGGDEMDGMLTEGRAMKVEQAIAYALGAAGRQNVAFGTLSQSNPSLPTHAHEASQSNVSQLRLPGVSLAAKANADSDHGATTLSPKETLRNPAAPWAIDSNQEPPAGPGRDSQAMPMT